MVALLLPARFLTLAAHFIATAMTFYSVDDNVKASLSTPFAQTDYDSVHSALLAALSLHMLFFALELYGLYRGLSVFRTGISLFYVVAHAMGVFFMSLFVLDEWHALSIWYLFVLFSALPGTIEGYFITNYLVLHKGTH